MQAEPEDRYSSARARRRHRALARRRTGCRSYRIARAQDGPLGSAASWKTAAAAAALLMIIVFTPISIVQQMRKNEVELRKAEVERERGRAQNNYDEREAR